MPISTTLKFNPWVISYGTTSTIVSVGDSINPFRIRKIVWSSIGVANASLMITQGDTSNVIANVRGQQWIPMNVYDSGTPIMCHGFNVPVMSNGILHVWIV